MRHNKEIVLITNSNSVFGPALEREGFRFIAYTWPVNESSLSEINRKHENRIAIFEMDCDTCDEAGPLLEAISGYSRKICVSLNAGDQLKNLLLTSGIPDLLYSPTPARLVQYLKIIEYQKGDSSGSMLLLGGENSHIALLSSILSRFNYSLIQTAAIPDIAKHSETGCIHFIAINLGSPTLDLGGLIREFMSNSVVRRIPILVYRDMSRGIFIHELLSGLNRISPYILTPEELYAFIVELLFRKEISPLIMSLHSQFCQHSVNFNAGTISKIYNTHRDELFAMKSIFEGDTISSTEEHADTIKGLLIKTEGLRWMIPGSETVEKITCGLGVSI